jgi:hypothetical protein
MTPDHDDRISGNYSMATSTDGAGKATRTKTIPTTDISGHTHLRFRRKIAKDEGYKMRAMKVRIGQDEDNYLEWNIEKIGSEYEDCRNWESVWLYKNATEIGEVDLTLCRRIQIEIDASADIHLNDIHFDEMSATTGSFTLGEAIRGSYKFKDVRINHRKPSDVIEDLAKMQGDFRYVDYEGEINYFTKQGEDVAAIEVSPDNQEFGSLSIAVDTIDLKNRQYVVGSEAPEPILYTQDEVSDGEETSRRLDYKPSGLKVFVSTNTGSSRDERTVGVEGLNKPEDFDFLFNFNEKIVKLGATGFIVNSGDIFRRQYFPYKPISYRFADLNSIAKMKSLTGGNGVFD